jgi:beta-glucosidase-like glycosyl hydrolase
MITGLKQAVQSGQISINAINASVHRILELKLKYKILSHDRALQLIDNQGANTGVESAIVGKMDGDVRKASL